MKYKTPHRHITSSSYKTRSDYTYFFLNKMNNNTYHTVGTFPKSNRKRGKTDTPNTQTHDGSPSWPGTMRLHCNKLILSISFIVNISFILEYIVLNYLLHNIGCNITLEVILRRGLGNSFVFSSHL